MVKWSTFWGDENLICCFAIGFSCNNVCGLAEDKKALGRLKYQICQNKEFDNRQGKGKVETKAQGSWLKCPSLFPGIWVWLQSAVFVVTGLPFLQQILNCQHFNMLVHFFQGSIYFFSSQLACQASDKQELPAEWVNLPAWPIVKSDSTQNSYQPTGPVLLQSY